MSNAQDEERVFLRLLGPFDVCHRVAFLSHLPNLLSSSSQVNLTLSVHLFRFRLPTATKPYLIQSLFLIIERTEKNKAGNQSILTMQRTR